MEYWPHLYSPGRVSVSIPGTTVAIDMYAGTAMAIGAAGTVGDRGRQIGPCRTATSRALVIYLGVGALSLAAISNLAAQAAILN